MYKGYTIQADVLAKQLAIYKYPDVLTIVHLCERYDEARTWIEKEDALALTLQENQRIASLFRYAAEIADSENSFWHTNSLIKRVAHDEETRERMHDVYWSLYEMRFVIMHENSWTKECYVLFLLFIAEAVETGDL